MKDHGLKDIFMFNLVFGKGIVLNFLVSFAMITLAIKTPTPTHNWESFLFLGIIGFIFAISFTLGVAKTVKWMIIETFKDGLLRPPAP